MVAVYRPRRLEEILAVRGDYAAVPFAGGTDLMVRRRGGTGVIPSFDTPVVFIDRCAELKRVTESEGGVEIGAAVTMSELIQHPVVHHSLVAILSEIASPALRNTATIGGNICNASPAADTLPFLYAFGASVSLRSVDRERVMPVEEFVTGPGTNELGDDEILTSVFIPAWKPLVSYSRKVGTRKANTLAKVSLAGFADVDDGTVGRIALSLGAVGSTVIRLREIEERCRGGNRREIHELVPYLPDLCRQAIHPIDDQRSTARYRRRVAENLVVSFLRDELMRVI